MSHTRTLGREPGSGLIGRLKPGVTLADAQGEVDWLAADLRARFPIKQTAGVHLDPTVITFAVLAAPFSPDISTRCARA